MTNATTGVGCFLRTWKSARAPQSSGFCKSLYGLKIVRGVMKSRIRRRTRVVGAFPDGHSALMLAAGRLRYITGTKWGTHRYLDMDRLKEAELKAG